VVEGNIMAVQLSTPSQPGDHASRLPQRVEEAIKAEQDRSENLIGWIQLAVILAFAALYFVSPKTAGSGSYLTVTAISIYLALTIIRLVMSHSFSMPPWMLALSVAFDMALLFGLIWSFHIQYGQPAAFYLKAPTLLYVFIFIALRALRLEVRFVVLAGALAALGWLVLVAYAIGVGSTDMITRDYIDYMTSNSVLIGAEFDKVVSIVVVTAIIAAAVSRSRRLLKRTVEEAFTIQDLSRFFAPEIAERIAAQGQDLIAGAGEIRAAAILNVDVRNFTRLAHDLPPDAVMRMLAEYQSCVVPIIQRHNGRIDKFMGDGIMATFGVTTPNETYAADALSALDEVMAEARRWSIGIQTGGGAPLRVNAAVASGDVVFGAVGDHTRLEYTVIGDAANLSAKLVKQNKVIGCEALTTRDTYTLALAQGYNPPGRHRTLSSASVVGTPAPMDLVVLSPGPGRLRGPSHPTAPSVLP
jgi:adenylate cyclase